MNEHFVHLKHLQRAAERFAIQRNDGMADWSNWSMCLCGPLCVIISGMYHSYHQTWAEDLWSTDEGSLTFELRRIPR